MDWIKKRYDQFLLSLAAIALLAFSILVVLKTTSFGERFTGAMATVPKDNTIPPLVLDRVDEAKTALTTPPVWVVDNKEPRTRGSLFVSEIYMLDKETGVPSKPIEGSLRSDSLTGNKIPNRWFIENGLPLPQANVALQDPDQDGFLNEDEFRASTDPNKKESHPPYHTKLFLKKYIPIPFRLVFKSYDGSPAEPEKMSFQMDTLDLRQPTMFLKLGEMVPKTKYRLEKFEPKDVENPNTGDKTDVSELTVVNTETEDVVVLVLRRPTNSPDVYGLLDYQWTQPPLDIQVKKTGEFALKPETDKRYKLVDIKPTEALILLPDGTKYTVLPDPRKPAQ